MPEKVSTTPSKAHSNVVLTCVPTTSE
jgi:hypothetical protein